MNYFNTCKRISCSLLCIGFLYKTNLNASNFSLSIMNSTSSVISFEKEITNYSRIEPDESFFKNACDILPNNTVKFKIILSEKNLLTNSKGSLNSLFKEKDGIYFQGNQGIICIVFDIILSEFRPLRKDIPKRYVTNLFFDKTDKNSYTLVINQESNHR